MFKKNKKSTENVKEKKVRTVKVGTHKKTVIALWVVLVASVSFGAVSYTHLDVYKRQKQGCWWKREEQLAKKQHHTGLTCR